MRYPFYSYLASSKSVSKYRAQVVKFRPSLATGVKMKTHQWGQHNWKLLLKKWLLRKDVEEAKGWCVTQKKQEIISSMQVGMKE